MTHVFLSHSSADAAGAKAVARLLQNASLPGLARPRPTHTRRSMATRTRSRAQGLDPLCSIGRPDRRAAVGGSGGSLRGRRTRWTRIIGSFPCSVPGRRKTGCRRFSSSINTCGSNGANPTPVLSRTWLRQSCGRRRNASASSRLARRPFAVLNIRNRGFTPFFGRDREVDELLERLSNTRFLLLVGTLVRASPRWYGPA